LENLTNWYIRFNRKRLKGQKDMDIKDTMCALHTLFEVLFILVRALAPFMPFLTERIYQLLAVHLPGLSANSRDDQRSVHFLAFPVVREDLFNEEIERSVSRMQKVIELARGAREKCCVGLKTPLRTLVVLADSNYVDDVRSLETYMREELNIRNLVLTSDEESYDVKLRAVPNWPKLGKKFKNEAQNLRKSLKALTNDQLRAFAQDKRMTIGGLELIDEDLTIVKDLGVTSDNDTPPDDDPKWICTSDNEAIILLDSTLYPELAQEGLVRDLISRVQRLRKKAGLAPTDDVRMEYVLLHNPSKN